MNDLHWFALMTALQVTLLTTLALSLLAMFRGYPAQRHTIGVFGLAFVVSAPFLVHSLPSAASIWHHEQPFRFHNDSELSLVTIEGSSVTIPLQLPVLPENHQPAPIPSADPSSATVLASTSLSSVTALGDLLILG